ncbi:TPA: hypothetical protein HA246_02995 [Candidatus Woesearchaeota archaeon]|nr:hypothetical protein [Candidatus Woesearchaeota archaeon]
MIEGTGLVELVSEDVIRASSTSATSMDKELAKLPYGAISDLATALVLADFLIEGKFTTDSKVEAAMVKLRSNLDYVENAQHMDLGAKVRLYIANLFSDKEKPKYVEALIGTPTTQGQNPINLSNEDINQIYVRGAAELIKRGELPTAKIIYKKFGDLKGLEEIAFRQNDVAFILDFAQKQVGDKTSELKTRVVELAEIYNDADISDRTILPIIRNDLKRQKANKEAKMYSLAGEILSSAGYYKAAAVAYAKSNNVQGVAAVFVHFVSHEQEAEALSILDVYQKLLYQSPQVREEMIDLIWSLQEQYKAPDISNRLVRGLNIPNQLYLPLKFKEPNQQSSSTITDNENTNPSPSVVVTYSIPKLPLSIITQRDRLFTKANEYHLTTNN